MPSSTSMTTAAFQNADFLLRCVLNMLKCIVIVTSGSPGGKASTRKQCVTVGCLCPHSVQTQIDIKWTRSSWVGLAQPDFLMTGVTLFHASQMGIKNVSHLSRGVLRIFLTGRGAKHMP